MSFSLTLRYVPCSCCALFGILINDAGKVQLSGDATKTRWQPIYSGLNTYLHTKMHFSLIKVLPMILSIGKGS